ncbi:MAG: aminomethyl-transferring glycine dehydrogenase subunit GcvPB, partial [Candidatus Hodarchaeota archaeon]
MGIHAPTIYFPLIVHGALLIEPTETESLERLDQIINVFKKIKKEAEDDPELLKKSPLNKPIGRLDQVITAREPIITFDALVTLLKKEKT